jgi:hypothetical protein
MPTTTTSEQSPQRDLLAWSCLELFTGLIEIKYELLPVCDSANDAIPHAVDGTCRAYASLLGWPTC